MTIDSREQRSGVPQLVTAPHIVVGNHEFDYDFRPLFIVERKTWQDFLASRRQYENIGAVRVNKVVRQLFRAMKFAQSVWLILEGTYTEDSNGYICDTKWTAVSTHAFLMRLQLRGVQVAYTIDATATARLIDKLYRYSLEASKAWPMELIHATA